MSVVGETTDRYDGIVSYQLVGPELGRYALGALYSILFLSVYLFYVLPIGQQLRRHAFWMGLALLIIFVLNGRKGGITVGDAFFSGLTIVSIGYLVLNYEEIVTGGFGVDFYEVVLGTLFLIALLEGTRRSYGVTGQVLFYLVTFFIIFMIFGHNLPGLWGHRQIPYERAISTMYLSTSATFSFVFGTIVNFVIPFIVFGKLLEHLGGTQYFMDISRFGTDRMRGGAPKLAVVASALMGMINGSVVANIASTGSATIPIMKKSGTSGRFAGAVESAASTGGQILPPIMGIAAFIMVGVTGIPYLEIISRSFIPAFLYFFGIFLFVHLSAVRMGLGSTAELESPSRRSLLMRTYYLIPIAVLVYFLVTGMTLSFTAVYSSIALVLVGLINKRSRLTFQRAKDIVSESMELSAVLLVLTGAIALIVGVTGRTGLGLKMTSLMIGLAGGSLALILLFTIVASFILGMGLSATILSYILLATLVAPALTESGIQLFSAHLFVLYYGIFALITPPVGLGIITAAGIADSDPTLTGITAIKICLPALILPILWVISPPLVLFGTPTETATATGLAIGVITLLTMSTTGCFRSELSNAVRVGLLVPTGILIYGMTLV